jgi:hypothetical protein
MTGLLKKNQPVAVWHFNCGKLEKVDQPVSNENSLLFTYLKGG